MGRSVDLYICIKFYIFILYLHHIYAAERTWTHIKQIILRKHLLCIEAYFIICLQAFSYWYSSILILLFKPIQEDNPTSTTNTPTSCLKSPIMIMFLIPLAYIPVSIVALCVLMGVIKNKTAVITIETIAVLSAISSCWILFILLNWLYLGN